jgi:hypothetical protein
MPTTISKKKIIYRGSLPSGTIEPGTGESIPFEKNKPLEVSAKLADELLKREDWEEAHTNQQPKN